VPMSSTLPKLIRKVSGSEKDAAVMYCSDRLDCFADYAVWGKAPPGLIGSAAVAHANFNTDGV